MSLWNQLSKPWQASVQMAWEAYCCGSMPIGAAVAGPDGKVLSTGRNRLFEQYQIGPESLSGTWLAHAEINALLGVDFQSLNTRECTLYTTTEPCPMCAGALVMARQHRLCFASRDPWAGSTTLLSGSRYLIDKQIRVDGPPDTRLETFLIAIQCEYRLRKRPSPDPVLGAYQAMLPQAVGMAKSLFQSGELLRMAGDGCPVDAVLERLEPML